MEQRINNYPKPDRWTGGAKTIGSDNWFRCAPSGFQEYTVNLRIGSTLNEKIIPIQVVANSLEQAESRALAVGETFKYITKVELE